MSSKLKIKKGDQVIVISGRDKGKKGEVLKVSPKDGRVIVQGINLVSKHVKASATDAGGIKRKEASMDVSNVLHIDPKLGVPTRIGYKLLEDGRKVRFAKRSGEVIDQ